MKRDTAVQRLRKRLQETKEKDPFENGEVIRWKVDAGRTVYVYAAIKCPAGWFTTARLNNPFIPAVIEDYDELIEILARPGVTMIEFASEWTLVTSQYLDAAPDDL